MVAITYNVLHIGAVGDLKHKTSNYHYTSLDVPPFNLPHQPLLLPICCYRLMRIFSTHFQ